MDVWTSLSTSQVSVSLLCFAFVHDSLSADVKQPIPDLIGETALPAAPVAEHTPPILDRVYDITRRAMLAKRQAKWTELFTWKRPLLLAKVVQLRLIDSDKVPTPPPRCIPTSR